MEFSILNESSLHHSLKILYQDLYEGDVEALASGIFGVTCSSLIYRLKKNKDVDVEKVYNGFINTVIKGISKE